MHCTSVGVLYHDFGRDCVWQRKESDEQHVIMKFYLDSEVVAVFMSYPDVFSSRCWFSLVSLKGGFCFTVLLVRFIRHQFLFH